MTNFAFAIFVVFALCIGIQQLACSGTSIIAMAQHDHHDANTESFPKNIQQLDVLGTSTNAMVQHDPDYAKAETFLVESDALKDQSGIGKLEETHRERRLATYIPLRTLDLPGPNCEGQTCYSPGCEEKDCGPCSEDTMRCTEKN